MPFHRKAEHELLRAYIYRCQGCGLCVNACPLGAISGILAPRARLAVLRAYLEAGISKKEASPLFSVCLQCGQCEKVCPAALPLKNIFAISASLLASGQKYLPEKLLYLLQRFPSLAAHLQTALGLLQRGRLKMNIRLFDLDLPPKPFPPADVSENSSKKDANALLLFTGCLSRNLDPAIAEACANLLRNCALPFHNPHLACCGRKNRLSGKKRESLSLVRKNLKLLSQMNFAYILTPCPACAQEISKNWPATEGLSKEERKFAEKIAEKVLDPTSLLHKQANEKALFSAPIPENSLFHLSCLSEPSSQKHLREIFPQGRLLLAENGANCCGGSLLCRLSKDQESKDLSDRLGRKLRDNILASGAQTLLTNCPACKSQLKKIMARHGDRIAIKHVAELYAELANKD